MGGTFSRSFEKEKEFLQNHSIDPKDCDVHRWNEKQQMRLHRIMNGDTASSTSSVSLGLTPDPLPRDREKNAVVLPATEITDDTFDSEFREFIKLHADWEHENSVLFFNKYPHIDSLKVLRRQTSGLCYMHAPVVLQHYLVSIYKGEGSDLKMIDVGKYIEMNWKGKQLLKYLKEDSGGSSVSFLEEINHHVNDFDTANYTIPPSDSRSFDANCLELMERLEFKPALVSNFRVDSSFHHGGTSFLAGAVNAAELSGQHAMVLIGCRACPTHKYVFLLQNWWKGRYFIEVSASYLASSKATISFVTQDIEYIPERFPVIRSSFVETTVDVGERMDEYKEPDGSL